ncbi:MAG: hypothetical protein M3N52_02840, partial [Actinomycetota bacterium]|nr:hypothetical protein [Actinomycetota bacterium]
PLMFQGGNVLVGDTFVLVGRDYLDDSVRKAIESGAIEGFPQRGSRAEQETFVSALFRRLFDSDRDVYFLGVEPSVRIPNWVDEVDAQRLGHDVERGSGARQPIFHIDMFLSLAGRDPESDRYRVLVGDPGLADRLLDLDRVPHDLQEEFDQIAAQLAELDFDVRRAPLPYVAVVSPGPAPIRVDGRTVLVDALEEWYHPTSSNCLVQIDGDARDVWLPTYGHGDFPWLSAVDDEYKRIWTELGFTVHQLGDFHPFARNLGALHCIKKYLAR